MNKEFQNNCFKIMKKARACFLTTLDQNGFPVTRAMLNLINSDQFPLLKKYFDQHNDCSYIYFTTNTSSEKVRQLRQNNKTAVYYCLPGKWKGLMFQGTLEIVEDLIIKKELWQDNWTGYYPGGYTDSDYSILKFKSQTGKLYSGLSVNIMEFGK